MLLPTKLKLYDPDIAEKQMQWPEHHYWRGACSSHCLSGKDTSKEGHCAHLPMFVQMAKIPALVSLRVLHLSPCPIVNLRDL